ncbi:nucleotidyltransferase family protein [Marinomonas sp. C2222]|uniref:Nucleotidyltransferase family protein n=1 Tax=Marinomonas sargassi TaxID=2984494 RepID=A0ABT2YT15_9GAMM|nr:nucleotidyltransferase family protein [Marinomonas sargassi]MCV2403035.1 nucleotidyltransferase family protein [Marinomonas sargassi]
MNYESQVKSWIESDQERMEALCLAASLGLGDWCLAAGFVRNLIWDKLHQKAEKTPLNDIDLIYFDNSATSENADLIYEAKLKALSHQPWSVKNQARMHIRNDDAPYLSCADAMSYWVEVETAVGVTFNEVDGLSIVSPFGLEANFNQTITLNAKRPKPKAFYGRIQSKGWQVLWPQLEVVA